MRRPGAAKYAQVPSEKDGVRLMLLGPVKGYALLPMLTGKGKLPKAEQCAPPHKVGSQETRWILEVLG